MPAEFTSRVIEAVKAIPHGRVATYGGIAALAGNPRAARQVARVLHACSAREGLPWHRVVNRQGRVALKAMQGFEEQSFLLLSEGVEVDGRGGLELARYLWTGPEPPA